MPKKACRVTWVTTLDYQMTSHSARRTSREMEEAAFKVLEQGWTCDVRVHVAPTEKAGRQRGAREQAQ